MNIEGFATRIVADSKSGCWTWIGSRNAKGYAMWQQSHADRSTRLVARLAWQTWRGTLNPVLQVDHLCRNTRCVNPAHLDFVTCAENLYRGQGVTGTNRRKTYCPRGHAYTSRNTITKPISGHRECRKCKYARTRAARKARIDGEEV